MSGFRSTKIAIHACLGFGLGRCVMARSRRRGCTIENLPAEVAQWLAL